MFMQIVRTNYFLSSNTIFIRLPIVKRYIWIKIIQNCFSSTLIIYLIGSYPSLYIQLPNDHTRQFARYILHDEWIIINLLKNIISMLENGNIRMWKWYESDAPFFVHEHTKYLYNSPSSITKMDTDYCKCYSGICVDQSFFYWFFFLTDGCG